MMGISVLKQPNGLYAMFSSYVDRFIDYNVTIEEVEEFFIEHYRDTVRRHIKDSLERSNLEEMLETIKRVHGEEIYKIAKKEVDTI